MIEIGVQEEWKKIFHWVQHTSQTDKELRINTTIRVFLIIIEQWKICKSLDSAAIAKLNSTLSDWQR